MNKNDLPEFNHYQHNAPEYTEEILWHRVYTVVGGIALLIALLGWGVFALVNGDHPEPAFNVDTLAATNAIPSAEITETGAELDSDSSIVEPVVPEQVAETGASNHTEVAQETEALPAQKPEAEESNNESAELAPTAKAISSPPAATNASSEAGSETLHKVDTTILNADITRAALTNAMRDLEPATELTSTDDLGDGFIKLYFYTDLQGHAGDTLIYSWYRNDKRVAKVRIPVGSDRWRSHASKNISANMRGSWKVVVTDRKGNALAESHFYLPESAS